MRVGADSRGGRLRSIHHTGRSTDRAEMVVLHCQPSPGRGRNTWLQNLANIKVAGGMADVGWIASESLLAIGSCALVGTSMTCTPA